MADKVPSESICVIPASEVSSSLPKKNFKKIGGIPLIGHTLRTVDELESVRSVYLATESEELADKARQLGSQAIESIPAEEMGPKISVNDVVSRSLEIIESERSDSLDPRTPILILHPNTPFLSSRDVREALSEFNREPSQAVVGVTRQQAPFWAQEGPTRQYGSDVEEINSINQPLYRETGALYVTNQRILEQGSRIDSDPALFVMDEQSSFEVNSLYDFWLAEKMYEGPDIVFRVDGGNQIGMGHIYRSLYLADYLTDSEMFNCDVTFLSNPAYEGGIEKLRQHDYPLRELSPDQEVEEIQKQDPDIVILDVLDTDDQVVEELRNLPAAIVNLEDREGGLEHADFVVNALYHDVDYDRKNYFFGPKYVLLRDDYLNTSSDPSEDVSQVMMTFGGSDPQNFSEKIVEELENHDLDYKFKLILGPDYKHTQKLKRGEDTYRNDIEILHDIPNMAEVMFNSNLAICSGGRTAYELMASGTPVIALAHNDREKGRMRYMNDQGALRFLGKGTNVDFSRVVNQIQVLDDDYNRRQNLIDRAQELVDGEGIERFRELILEILTS